jgi:cysteinyl-tRNA synthetase
MSKSLGNFHTLRNVLERGYTGRETRYVLMAGHYRQSLNFTFDALDAARKSLERLDEFQERLADLAGGVTAGERPGWAAEASRRFDAALEEDLNVPESLAALFDLVHAGNKRMNEQAVPGPQAAAVLGLLDRFDRVLGVLAKPQEEAPAAAAALLEKRQRARQAKNWAESDRLRNQLAELGWLIQDTPQGAKLKRK